MSIYTDVIPAYGHTLTVGEFRRWVKQRLVIDYDGFGHPVRKGKMAGRIIIQPSNLDSLPLDATHVQWFNR